MIFWSYTPWHPWKKNYDPPIEFFNDPPPSITGKSLLTYATSTADDVSGNGADSATAPTKIDIAISWQSWLSSDAIKWDFFGGKLHVRALLPLL